MSAALALGLLGVAAPVAVLGTAAPAAAAVTPAPAARNAVPTLQEQLNQAAAGARASGQPVTVDALTSATSTTVAEPSGRFRVSQSSAPVRVKHNGAWTNLDPTLRNSSAGVTPAATTSGLVLSGGGTGALATMGSQGRTLALSWPGTLPKPVLSGATATYPAVIPDVDLVVTVDPQGGFSEVLVVKTRAAAADPRLASLTMAIQTTGGLAVSTDAAGNITAKQGASGAPVFTAAAPRMWDSSTRVAPIKATVTAVRSAATAVSGDHRAASLNLVPDHALLTDPKAVFPLYVDPTWTAQWAGGSRSTWAQVDTISSGIHIKPSELQNGYDGWSSGMKARDFVQFSVPSQLQNGAQIYSSGVDLTVQHGPYNTNCSGASKPGLQLWWTGAISSSQSWSSQPSWIQDVNTQYPKACDGQAVHFDVTSFMQAHSAGATTMTFGLRASDESDEYAWKEITASTLTMSTEYDHAPSLPASPSTSPGGACQSGNPGAVLVGNDDVTFQTVASDPDGGQLGTEFVIKDYSGGTVRLDTGSPATAAASLTTTSGQVARLIVPRSQIQGWHSDGASKAYQYSWYTLTSDGKLTSPATGLGSAGSPCTFTYDPTAPSAPTLSPVTSAVALGKSVPVTITPAPGSSPARYTYSVDNGPTTYAPGAGGTQTITVTPTRIGVNTLNVTALSASGNPSATVTETLQVDPPATPYADGDLTGSGHADVLTVGTASNAGLWLSPSDGAGRLSTPTDIGVYGTGLNSGNSATDWNGDQVLHGDFTGDHVQDVLAYNPAGSGALLYGHGDANPLLTTTGNQKNLNVSLLGDTAINAAANNGNGDYPTQLVAAGNASLAGNPVPDLIGVAGDGGDSNYELDLYTGTAFETYNYTETLAGPGQTPDGPTWNGYTFAVAQPVAPFHQSVLFALNTATGSLWKAVNTTDGSTTTWTGATPTLSWTRITGGPWTANAGPALVSADVNAAGSIELWTRNGFSATPYTLSGTTLTAGSASGLFAPTHEWPLTDGSGTAAADLSTATGSAATLNGGVGWTSDPLRGTVAGFDGTTGYLRLPDGLVAAGGGNLAVTMSFRAAPGAQGVLLSTGSDVPAADNSSAGPVLYIGTDGKLYAQFWNGAVSPIVSRTPVADGQWHTASLVATGATQTLYLDDQVPTVNVRSAAISDTNPELFVGAGVINTAAWVNAPGGTAAVHPSYFTGSISDVSLTSGAVTAAELAPRNVPTAATGTITAGVGSGLCIDDAGAKAVDSNPVQIYTCNNNQAQNWTPQPNGELHMYGKCLDIVGGASATANHTQVDLYQCLPSNGVPAVNQNWVLRSNGSIYNPNSGRCLDDPNSTTTPGTQLQIYDCNNTNAQKWTPLVNPVVPLTGTIVAGIPSAQCVDNEGGSATSPGNVKNGNLIQLWPCDNYPSQQWTLNPTGTISLAAAPGYCLDIYNAGTADGTKVQLLTCHTGGDYTGYQMWQPYNGGLWNAATGKCLDSGAGTNGTSLQLWTCNNTGPQKFSFP